MNSRQLPVPERTGSEWVGGMVADMAPIPGGAAKGRSLVPVTG